MIVFDKIDPALIHVVEARYGRMMVLTNDRYLGAAFLRHGEYSEAEVDLWRQLFPDARKLVACDIGANIGAHTIPLAGMFGYVWAFEPLPFTHRLLTGNVALNGLANVEPVRAAVGATRGTIPIPALDYTVPNNYGGFDLRQFADHQGTNPGLRVPLDEVVPVAHFLKIDVEGMELEVLQGATRLLTQCRPVLYFEANPEEGHPKTDGPKQRELIRWVQGQGYDCHWHFAPHYNPDNLKGAPPVDEHERTVVSFNVLAMPTGSRVAFEGLEPIARIP